MRFACVLIISAFVFNFAPAIRADDPKDKPKENKPDQQVGGSRKLVVGKWSPSKDDDKTTIEFTKDGKIKISGAQNISIDGKYKFIDDSTLQVDMSYSGEEKSIKLKFTVTQDELTTQEIGDGSKEKPKETFKRAK
jgi:uncharacterized protein (TIGR03066 family)